MPWKFRRIALAIISFALLLLCWGPSPARAGNGTVQELPFSGKPGKSGLRLEVDARWVDANGYRPVRIRVRTATGAAAVADRSLRIRLETSSWRWRAEQPVVTGYLELPQGASFASTSISVPQFAGWETLQVTCYEDGSQWQELSGNFNVNRINNYQWSEAVPCVLVIDRDAPDWTRRAGSGRTPRVRTPKPGENQLPDVRALVTRFPAEVSAGYEFSTSQQLSDDMTLQIVDSSSRLELLCPPDLPDRWIELTCFDLIFIAAGDLQWTARRFPRRSAALADWVRAGNALVVFDAPAGTEPRSMLDASLDASPARDTNDEEVWQEVTRGRNELDLQGVNVPGHPFFDDRNGRHRLGEDARLHRRKLGMGRVYAASAEEPRGIDAMRLTWILNDLSAGNWMWFRRHGLSMHRKNRDFGNWPIPGVGRSPVKSYLALITLFVIAIGPVNYLWLRKRKRLYLLLVTVPLGAGLVSFLLFNYALITDGLGVRGRIRSYTEIDQRIGRSVSWSRQTYYAGLAPSRGLEFPARATVLPIHAAPPERRRGVRRERRLIWTDVQWLASGYLGSRSTAQFLVQQVQPTSRGLLVRPVGDGRPPEVTNRLETRLQYLLLRDAGGGWYRAQDIAAGASFRPQAVEGRAGWAPLHSAYAENLPQFPPGYDSAYAGGRWFYTGNLTELDQSASAPSCSHSLLELASRERLGAAPSLSPRSYVAIVPFSPEVPRATDRLREEASFHVVFGRW